jgi:hypothetical protein
MAALGQTVATLADLAKMMAPNGSPDTAVIELLSKRCDMMKDMLWLEGNLPTGHRTTLRTALPTVSYRQFNYGVAASKSARMQIEEQCAMLEAYSQVDTRLMKLYGNAGDAYRQSEDMGFIEAMTQQVQTDMFTGNKDTSPDKFDGFATRYSDVNYGESSSTAKDGSVVEGGGSGSDNASIWLVCWGQDSVHGIYPKGTSAGLKHNDLGQNTAVDSGGLMYEVLRSHFTWDVGLCVRDWRYVIRIANLDVSNMLTASSAPDLHKLAARAVDRIPNTGGVRPVWYMNRLVKSMLREQRQTGALYTLTREQVQSEPVDTLYGYPVRIVDALGIAETQLT